MIVCTQLDPSNKQQHRMKERLSDNEILFTQITKLNAELFCDRGRTAYLYVYLPNELFNGMISPIKESNGFCQVVAEPVQINRSICLRNTR